MNALFTMSEKHHWYVTGIAGFIGSHLLEALLHRDHYVTGFDNFSTGHQANLEDVQQRVSTAQWGRFRMIEGSVTSLVDVHASIRNADYVLHQAALGSVPLSVEDPLATHANNVTGLLNVLIAAREAGVRRLVYTSSSAVYGDCQDLPATEDRIGRPLSPYAASKAIDEEYAGVFERCYGLESVGLRYFNVFGPRQDPAGAYAAVIPRWIDALLHDRPVEIFGDGETSRDFCHVDNVVEANLLAATANLPAGAPRTFNVGLGRATSLNQLFTLLSGAVNRGTASAKPLYREFRSGDVRHSWADISRIQQWLGFKGGKDLATGLVETARWFANRG